MVYGRDSKEREPMVYNTTVKCMGDMLIGARERTSETKLGVLPTIAEI